MASIQARLASTTANTGKIRISPDIYQSVVKKTKVDYRYKDGAFIVTYELKGENKTYTYEELFVDNLKNKRTRKFYKYLAENGIDDIENFVGCQEELDLRWNFTNTGKRELTIVERTFIGFREESESTVDAENVD